MTLRSCVVGGRDDAACRLEVQTCWPSRSSVPRRVPTAGKAAAGAAGGQPVGGHDAGQTHVTCKERAGLNGAFLRIPESVKHNVEQQPTSRTLARRCQSRGRRCQAAQQLSTHGLQSFDGRMLVLAPARPRGSQRKDGRRSAGSIRRARLAMLQERGPTSGRAWRSCRISSLLVVIRHFLQCMHRNPAPPVLIGVAGLQCDS